MFNPISRIFASYGLDAELLEILFPMWRELTAFNGKVDDFWITADSVSNSDKAKTEQASSFIFSRNIDILYSIEQPLILANSSRVLSNHHLLLPLLVRHVVHRQVVGVSADELQRAFLD